MRIDFIDNNNLVATTNKLIDIDLAFYDKLFVSMPIAPEVRFSVAYNHLDINDPFVNWWKSVTINEIPDTIFAVIYDGDGYEIASGDLFEYEENLEDFSLQILIIPGFTQQLDEDAHKKKEKKRKWAIEIFKESSLEYCSYILHNLFNHLWNEARIPYNLQLNSPIQGLYPDFAHGANALQYIAETKILSGDEHYFQFTYDYNGSKADFIENLTITNMCKLTFSRANNRFISKPLNSHIINGYIKGTSFDELDDIDYSLIIRKILLFDISGANKDVTNMFYAHINRRIDILKARKNYNIWATSKSWIYPGDSITLDNINYIVREIIYQPFSLDSSNSINNNIKIFDAVCIKS